MRSFLLTLGVLALPALAAAQAPLVRGIVRSVGDSGRPVEGAEVTIARRSATTNAEGRFQIAGLRAGLQPVLIRRIGFRPIRAVLEVYPEVPTEAEYYLSPEPFQLPDLTVEVRRTGIYGVVLNPSSEAIPGAAVEILGNRGQKLSADGAGRFALPEARSGTFLARVSQPGYRERWVSFTLELGRGRDLSIHLIPGTADASSNEMSQQLFDLSQRLAFGLRRHFMSGSDLERYGALSVCEVPRIKIAIGRQQRARLNGETRLLPGQVCTWRANEVALFELAGAILWEKR